MPVTASASRSTINSLSEATSPIWSGYAASTGATYRSITASWTVPNALCIAGDDSPAAAQWAGLDGFGTPTVIQAGTGVKCVNGGQPSYWAWIEMPPMLAFRSANPVAAGDTITVTVSADTMTSFTSTMSNTSGVHDSWTWAQTVDMPLRTNWPTTAEVVTEAVPVGVKPVEVVPTTVVEFTDISIVTTLGATGGFKQGFLYARVTRNGPTSQSLPNPMSSDGASFSVPSPVPTSVVGGPIATPYPINRLWPRVAGPHRIDLPAPRYATAP